MAFHAPVLEDFFGPIFLHHLADSLRPAIGPFLLAAILAAALSLPAMVVARRLGMVAVPGGRHIHLRQTPKLGGWALYIAFATSVAWFLGLHDGRILGLLATCGLAAMIFTYDDRFQMPALAKLGVETGLALLAILGFGLQIGFFTLPNGHVVELGLAALPLTLLWLLGMQNTINLLDGVDGLAAGVVAIVAVVLAVAAISKGNEQDVLLSAALAGCCAGFLVFNFYPARIFMGDSGSQFLGLALGLLSIIGLAKVATGFALALPLLALAVPIADTAWAIVRRRRAGLSIAHADTRHIHHQLLDFGMNQRQTCLIFYGATATLGALGLMLYGHRRILAVAVVAILVALSTVAGERLQGVSRMVPVPGFRRLLAAPDGE